MLESKGRKRAIFEERVIEKLLKLRKKGIEYTFMVRERILNNFVEKGRSEVIA